jgi:hypothetical protein
MKDYLARSIGLKKLAERSQAQTMVTARALDSI